MKIAVIGAGGQLGIEVCKSLAASYDVIGICRNNLTKAIVEYHGIDAFTYEPDVDGSLTQLLVSRQIDTVLNCSYSGGLDRASLHAYRRMLCETKSASVRTFIHFSSVAVYGERKSLSVDLDRARPDTEYGLVKLRHEDLVTAVFAGGGCRLVTIRLGHVFGPGLQWSDALCKIADECIVPEALLAQPSNAIGVKCLCATLLTIVVSESITGIWNLVETPLLTWGRVLELHRSVALCDGGRRPVSLRPRSTAIESLRSLLISLARSVVGSAPDVTTDIKFTLRRYAPDLAERVKAIYLTRLPAPGHHIVAEDLPDVFGMRPVPGRCLTTASGQSLADRIREAHFKSTSVSHLWDECLQKLL